MEIAARRQALCLAARALEQKLNADTSDYVGPALPCPCGHSYHGRHKKTYVSASGALHLKRAYYYDDQCHSGFCPRDRDLKLELFSLTPGVLRMTGSAAALLSFEESSELTARVGGSRSEHQAGRTSGGSPGREEIAADERQQVEGMGEVAPTMYLGMDGTGVPMRKEEVADRAGKQAVRLGENSRSQTGHRVDGRIAG